MYVGKKLLYNNMFLIKAENSPFESYWDFGRPILGYFVENFIHSILTLYDHNLETKDY
jgi:hypothetical protein